MTVITDQNPKQKLKRQKTTSGAGFIIEGGYPLKGEVILGGAKNASFKEMIAVLLLERGRVKLSNVSPIGDVLTTKKIIKMVGGEVKEPTKRSYLIDASRISSYKIPQKLALETRAPIIFVGPLLARFGKAHLPFPGGDRLGRRPLDRHFEALRHLGVKIKILNNHFIASSGGLKGGEITFPKNTHTGTEVLILTAIKARGKTVINNAAAEPEVDDLILLLNKMGAKIKRVAKRRIVIEGVGELRSAEHEVMSDRNEAVTFASVALGTKGDIFVKNASRSHLEAFLEKLEETGAGFAVERNGIRFFSKQPLKATKVKTAPHPGFMTDWQPLWTTLMTSAQGESQVIETIFPNRFSHVQELKEMGAKITLFNPEVKDPNKFYNFDLEDDKKEYFHGAKIFGPTSLGSIETRVANLRVGATLVLAALMARGRSQLSNIGEIDRGYEDLDKKLIALGAKMARI